MFFDFLNPPPQLIVAALWSKVGIQSPSNIPLYGGDNKVNCKCSSYSIDITLGFQG